MFFENEIKSAGMYINNRQDSNKTNPFSSHQTLGFKDRFMLRNYLLFMY